MKSADTKNEITKTVSRPLLMALAIGMVCLIPRLLLLSKGPFHFDTMDLLMEMRNRAISQHGVFFPLPSFIMIALSYIKDLSPVKISDLAFLLVLTAFISSISSSIIYLVYRKLFDEMTAIVYAVIVSFIPVYFSITTYGRIDHAISFIFLPFSLFYCLKKKWISCSIFTGLAICSRAEIIWALPAFFIYIAMYRLQGRERDLRGRIFAAARDIFILGVVSLGIWVLVGLVIGRDAWVKEIVQKVLIKQFEKKNIADLAVMTGFDLKRVFSEFRLIVIMMALCSLFTIIGVIKNIKQKKYKEIALFLLLFFVPFFFLSNMSGYKVRHSVSFLFFILYFASDAIVAIFKKPLFITLAALVCAGSMLVYIFPVVYPIHKKAYQVDFVKYLESVTDPRGLVIAQDEAIFIKYYSHLEAIYSPVTDDMKEWSVFFGKINSALRAGRPVYLLSSALAYDRYMILRGFIEDNFWVKEIGTRKNENWRVYLERHVYDEHILRIIPDDQHKTIFKQ